MRIGIKRVSTVSNYSLYVNLKVHFFPIIINVFSVFFPLPIERGSVIHTAPFKCCLIPNFIADEDFLKSLEKELLQLKFFEKSNDLYKFHQVI